MTLLASFGVLNYTVLVVYLVAIVTIGIVVAGSQKTTEDYFLAGRRMPWLVVAMSMFASLTSATSYMGVPGASFSENCSLIMIGAASILVAPLLILLFYPFYRRLNITTTYEYIDRRFGQSARFAISGLFVLTRLGWLGVVIYAPALAISVATGLNLYVAIVLMGLLAVTYTVLGGLAAVLWTDVVQFLVLIGGAVWVAISLVNGVPEGVSGILQIARETDHLVRWDVSLYEMSGTVAFVAFFFTLMQDYGTDQVTVQRLMAVRSYREMAQATLLNSFFDLVVMSLLLFLGLGMYAYYHHHSGLLPEGIGGDKVLPFYIMQALPNGVSGLLITALFAAAMSSMDSGINSLATVVVNDFIRPLRKQESSETNDVKLARWITVGLGGFAVGAAFYASTIESVLKAASTFLGLFSGPILALFVLGMVTKFGSFRAWGIATVIAVVVTYSLQSYENPETEQTIHWLYYFPCCFGLCFGLSFVFSLVLPCRRLNTGLTIWNKGLSLDGSGDS